MPKPVLLSLHKTNQSRRAAKKIRDDIRACVKGAQRDFGAGITGYALVIWNDDGASLSNWLGTDSLGGYPVEDYVRRMILRAKTKMDVETAAFRPEDDDV